MTDKTNVQTSVQQVDVDIDSWLGTPGADSIITPTAEEAEDAKPNIFSSRKQDLTFLDKGDDQEEGSEEKKEEAKQVIKELDKEFLNQPDDEEETSKSKGGRPRTEKSGLVEFLKKRIESNEMFAFDDYDEKKESLDDYLGKLGEKDIEDLWKANIDNMKQEVASQTPQQFFESLPKSCNMQLNMCQMVETTLKDCFKPWPKQKK